MATKTANNVKFGGRLDYYRRDMDSLRQELEEAEELALKQKRELNDLRNSESNLQSEVSRLQKNKRRLQNELDQLNSIFEQERSEVADFEMKLKKQGKMLSEEKRFSLQLEEDKRNLQKNIKTLELKVDALTGQNMEYDKRVVELELAQKGLRNEIDSLTDSRDDARLNISNVEKDKRILELKIQESNKKVTDLESELRKVEQDLMNVQGTLQTSKQRHSSEVARKVEKLEEAKMIISKMEVARKNMLEDEKKKRDQLAAARKDLESNIDNLMRDLDACNMKIEEQQKAIRRQASQLTQLKEVQLELGEVNKLKESLIKELCESEKKAKGFGQEIASLQDQLVTSERARRQAEDEACESVEEHTAAKNALKAQAAEEKRIMEVKIADIQSELQEEKVRASKFENKAKKIAKEIQAVTDKIAYEEDERKGVEMAKSRVEKQNRELEAQLDKMDTNLKEKVRETTENLGRRIHELEVAIDAEIKEREVVTKQLKRTEKALSEATSELADTTETAESYKGQADKLNKKCEMLKREMGNQEDDLKRLTLQRAAAEVELEEKTELAEQLKKDIARSGATRTSTRAASRSRSRMERMDDSDLLED